MEGNDMEMGMRSEKNGTKKHFRWTFLLAKSLDLIAE